MRRRAAGLRSPFVGTDDGTPGGTPGPTLHEELKALAAAHPDIVKAVETDAPSTTCDSGAEGDQGRQHGGGRHQAFGPLLRHTQHAREWLATETNRRMAHLFVDNYGETGPATDQTATRSRAASPAATAPGRGSPHGRR